MTKTLFYRWFGFGRVPDSFRERLDAEGVLCEEEGIRLATNLRRFKGPWRFGVDKGSRRSGALVVTSRRLVGFSRSRTAINIPWEHPSLGKLRIEVESPSVLLIAYEAQHFIPNTTGTIELRFRLRDPAAFLAAIATARGARN